MAQNVIINGVTYSEVPEVAIPRSSGGTASFFDIDDATISGNSQLVSGVTAYGSGGIKYVGSVTLPVISQDSTTKILSIS